MDDQAVALEGGYVLRLAEAIGLGGVDAELVPQLRPGDVGGDVARDGVGADEAVGDVGELALGAHGGAHRPLGRGLHDPVDAVLVGDAVAQEIGVGVVVALAVLGARLRRIIGIAGGDAVVGGHREVPVLQDGGVFVVEGPYAPLAVKNLHAAPEVRHPVHGEQGRVSGRAVDLHEPIIRGARAVFVGDDLPAVVDVPPVALLPQDGLDDPARDEAGAWGAILADPDDRELSLIHI